MSSGSSPRRRSTGGALVPEAAAVALLRRTSILAQPAPLCPRAGRESESERREGEDNVPSHPPTLSTLYLLLVCLSRHTVYGENEKGKGGGEKKKRSATSLAAVCAEKWATRR